MMRYSVQPREQIFVKSYGFLFFAKNMSKNNGKSKSKNLSGKYRIANYIFWNFSLPKAFYYDPPKFSRKPYPSS